MNAAAQPFWPGFARLALYWLTTCCFTVASHVSGVTAVGVVQAQRPELHRVGERRQRLEELHAAGEVVDREPGVRVERDPGRQRDAEERRTAGRAPTARAGS